MGYFKELPNISYVSRFQNSNRNDERILVKNLFKRAKLRTDIDQAITAFEYYQIQDDMRPDFLAEKIYGNSEYDWVILTTNNITNVRDQWPLSNNDLYSYMLEKYGSDQEISEVHHYETTEIKDEFDRIILPEGLEVDEDYQFTYTNFDNTVSTSNPVKAISNYEYEVKRNEDKRIIKILKPNYLSVFITDMRNIMRYDRSSQYINQTTKESYNPYTTGV